MKQALGNTWLILTAALATPGAAQQATLQQIIEHVQIGVAALEAGDTAGYLAGTGRAYSLAPTIPDVVYLHARAHALAGDSDSAVALLSLLARQGAVASFEAAGDSAFAGLAGTPGFLAALAAIERSRRPVSHSTVAHELPERDLIPEGVAHDPRSGTLFLGSMYKRKIVAIGRDGAVRDFVASGADGLGPVVGMEVDPERRTLWAAAMYLPEGNIPFPDTTYTGAGVLFKYDVDSGRLIKRYVLPPEAVRHGFNDLTVVSGGDVYVTDSHSGGIYRVAAGADTVALVVDPGTYIFPNGITRTPDGKRLFVAHAAGIDRIDLPSLQRTRLATPDSVNIGGIDGLAFHQNTLVAHQPSWFNQVVRLYLDGEQKRVTHGVIVERHHPRFAVPTTGEVAGDTYYYIANAQLRRFRDGKIFPWQELDPVLILRTELD